MTCLRSHGNTLAETKIGSMSFELHILCPLSRMRKQQRMTLLSENETSSGPVCPAVSFQSEHRRDARLDLQMRYKGFGQADQNLIKRPCDSLQSVPVLVVSMDGWQCI